MSDVFSQMNGGQLIGFFAVVGSMLLAVVSIVGGVWVSVRSAEFRARRHELDVGLKRDMINRGMSVDEIERVLAAGRAKDSACSALWGSESASGV
jgi:hypothetical protein